MGICDQKTTHAFTMEYLIKIKIVCNCAVDDDDGKKRIKNYRITIFLRSLSLSISLLELDVCGIGLTLCNLSYAAIVSPLLL